MSAQSITSCTELEASMPKPVARAAITSLMVAENGKRLRGQRARRNVEDRGGEFAGDLEHIGDHQQQALRGREGGSERAGLQCAMQRAGRSAFALHFDHRGHGAPDVGFSSADHWSAHSPMGDDGVIG